MRISGRRCKGRLFWFAQPPAMPRGKIPSHAYQTSRLRGNRVVAALQAHRVVLALGLIALWAVYLLAGSGRHRQQGQPSHLMAAALAGRLTEESLGQHSPDSLRAALQKAIGFQESHTVRSQSDTSGESTLLLAQIQSVLHDLTEGPSAVECSLDPTLFAEPFSVDQSHRVLLAANMHNNEELLPHFIAQLVHVLSLLPYGTAFLSVYESGSEDGTGAWLEVLRRLVTLMHIPHRIVTGGNLTRVPDQDRIDFLAQARNRALEPLWLNATAAATSDYLGPASDKIKVRKRRLTSWFKPEQSNESAPLWPAERVVFMNDVYFCAQDVIRLLRHKADIACGMDFDRLKLQDTPWAVQRQRFGAHLKRRFGIPELLGRHVGRIKRLMERWRMGEGNDEFQRGTNLEFYDTWVARDIDGNLLSKQAPYVTDPYSLERAAKGLPFPVKCCWNGVIAMKAAPFSQHDLRIRMHKAGECAASECSLMCNDFLRLGLSEFLIDPGVRQAYLARDARDLYTDLVKELPVTNWQQVDGAPAIDRSLAPMRPYVKCCGLKEGRNMIEFDKDCGWDNWKTPNYTSPHMPLYVANGGNQSANTNTSTDSTFRRARQLKTVSTSGHDSATASFQL